MVNPCANFFPEMEFNGSGAVDLSSTGTGDCDDPLVVNADFLISDDPGNAIEERVDGAYAAPEILCSKHSFNFDENLSVSTFADCNTWELVPAGSAVSFLSPYLHKPAAGSGVQVSIYEPNGSIVSTLNIAAGQTTGNWTTTTFNAGISNRRIAAVVRGVGSSFAGCGLNIPFQVCEPYSAYADPGSFYDNLDPSQLCSIISANCNASVTEITPGVYRHTANDGTITDMPITGFGPGDVSPFPDNAITYNQGAFVPKVEVFTYAYPAEGFNQSNAGFSGAELDAVPYLGEIYTQTVTLLDITNPSSTRSMKLSITESLDYNVYTQTMTGSLKLGPTGAVSSDPKVSNRWGLEYSINSGPWRTRREDLYEGRGIFLSGSAIAVDWEHRTTNNSHGNLFGNGITLGPSQNYKLEARVKFRNTSSLPTPKWKYDYFSTYGYGSYNLPRITAIGILV